MRVAILNRRRDTHPGGDLTQIDGTIAGLTQIGIHAEYAPEGWTIEWLRTFDLVHIFHCNFGWSVYNYARTLESGVPYVLTPIFYPATDLGASAEQMAGMLFYAGAVVPQSVREFGEMCGVLGVSTSAFSRFSRTVPIPNGTDTLFHNHVRDEAGRKDNRVICVTPRAGDKNTDVVESICAELRLPFHLVTGITDPHELARTYWYSHVFVNASLSERMSLTTGEALCAGCRVIDTAHNRGGVWYGSELVRVDPNDRGALTRAIYHAYHSRTWSYEPNRRARMFTWEWVARQLSRVYDGVLRGATRG